MAEPVDIILPLLREMRAANARQFGEILARLGMIEATQVSFRHALSAETLDQWLHAQGSRTP